ncbi:MAG: hypothetical protein IK082_05090 [Oscillospiraceae bacterium]|nr:hypothetical protein [Oscillospiraceae bacterium]
MRYMIHACPPRMWYVEQYLIPSMKEQGIAEEEIIVWNDKELEGNLPAFIASMRVCAKQPGGTWHLQDDVIICRRFAELTRENDEGLVCGFHCNNFRKFPETHGRVPALFAWYSFPCIRIPNDLAVSFLEWFDTEGMYKYQSQYIDKKHDDWFFSKFCEDRKDLRVLNLKPNLVDHVDYLIGGTLINQARLLQVNRAAYFEDGDLVDELERKLNSQ